MRDWTRPYCGVQHLNGLRKDGPLRQVTLTNYDSFVQVYALGPRGFSSLWEERHETVEAAQRAGEEFADSIKAWQ